MNMTHQPPHSGSALFWIELMGRVSETQLKKIPGDKISQSGSNS
jgi:hypothetical protein